MKNNNIFDSTKGINVEKPVVGLKVIGLDGHKGIIVSIVEPTDDDHGWIEVWQSERDNYGDNNCEHYAYYNNELDSSIFKVIEVPEQVKIIE